MNNHRSTRFIPPPSQGRSREVQPAALLIATLVVLIGLIERHPISPLSPSPLPGGIEENPGASVFPTPVLPVITVALPTPLPPYRGIWLSGEEVARLPAQGPAWEQLLANAQQDPGPPNLADQDQMHDVYILAKALVYARTGQPAYRQAVLQHLMQAIGTEQNGTTLALGRNLVPYVIAADLIHLPANSTEDLRFRTWLRNLLSEPLSGRTLRSTHETRPNNWGTHAGASRAAIAAYLGDSVELAHTAAIFQAWVGESAGEAPFRFGRDLSWQVDPQHPVAIQPPGATKAGHLLDGALAEEMRRGGPFQWPPIKTGYPWEALQGAIVQAEILSRAGYPTWSWGQRALLRAVQFLYRVGWPAEGDDEWQIWLINARYGTSFPAALPARPGKNMGWTDWTHARQTSSSSNPQASQKNAD